MPYIAEVPGSLVTTDVNGYVVDTNQTHVLNGFFTNVEETTGPIQATNEGGDWDTAEAGETLTVPSGSGSISGEYVGPVTLSTTDVTVGLPGFLGINVQLNDVEGHAIVDDTTGDAYIISDQDLAEDRLGATVSVVVAGIPITLVDVPLSEINDQLADAVETIPLVGPGLASILRNGANLGQQVIDTAVFTVSQGSGELGVVCFARGTLIRTQRGDIPVEELRVGDLVCTRDNDLQAIRWIGSVRLGRDVLSDNPNLRPIRIKAGALGTSIPSADLVVSPQHRILVRSKVARRMFGTDEVLAAAKQFLKAEGVDIATDMDEVVYFHMLFDHHEVVVSNGAETESLFTGSESLKGVGKAARDEIFALFPGLRKEGYAPTSARALLSGRQARKLAMRHVQNNKPFVHYDDRMPLPA